MLDAARESGGARRPGCHCRRCADGTHSKEGRDPETVPLAGTHNGSVLGFGQGYAPRHIRVAALYLAALSLTSSSSKWVGLPAPAAERQSTGKTMLRSVASESSVAAGSKGAPRPPQWMGGSGSQSATEPVASSAPSLVATRRAPSLRTLHKVVEQHLPRSRPPAGASPSAVRTARGAARGLAGTALLE